MLISHFRAAAAAFLLGGFAAGAVQSHAATVLIDFGGSAFTTGGETWNTLTTAVGITDTGQLLDLKDSTGQTTDIDLLMVARFSGANNNGTTASTLYPASATQDSLYGNTETWEGRTDIFPVFKLASLDSGLPYDLTFYGSRTGVGDNRETLYTVTGASVSTATLNVANNIDNTVSLFGVFPNEFGEIQIALTEGQNNNNGNSFTYLGVLEVEYIPEPSSAMLLLGGGALLGLRRRSRS